MKKDTYLPIAKMNFMKLAVANEKTLRDKIKTTKQPENVLSSEIINKVYYSISNYKDITDRFNIITLDQVSNTDGSMIPELDQKIYNSLQLFTSEGLEVIDYLSDMILYASCNLTNHFVHSYLLSKKTKKEFNDIDLDHTNFIVYKTLLGLYANNYGINMTIILNFIIPDFDSAVFNKEFENIYEKEETEFEQFKIFEKYALKYDTSEI